MVGGRNRFFLGEATPLGISRQATYQCSEWIPWNHKTFYDIICISSKIGHCRIFLIRYIYYIFLIQNKNCSVYFSWNVISEYAKFKKKMKMTAQFTHTWQILIINHCKRMMFVYKCAVTWLQNDVVNLLKKSSVFKYTTTTHWL